MAITIDGDKGLQSIPSGAVPAFSAYLSGSDQSVSSGVATKVTLNTEDFDTANAFDSTTNYRFQPSVAGYYQISASIYLNTTSGAANYNVTHLYKNGSVYKTIYNYISSGSVSTPLNCLVYLNGSTDYIELYGQISGTSPYFAKVSNGTYMTGVLVRAV